MRKALRLIVLAAVGSVTCAIIAPAAAPRDPAPTEYPPGTNMSIAGGPALTAWRDFLRAPDNGPGEVALEVVSSLSSVLPARQVGLYPGDSVCGMLARRGDDYYVTVYDMSQPRVTMLGERRVDMPTPLPLEGLTLQQPDRLVVLSRPESGAISYPRVDVSGLSEAEADELGRRRLLEVMCDTEGGAVIAVDVTGETAVGVPFEQLPGGRIILRDPWVFWEGASGADRVFTRDGGRLGYLLPQGER